MGIKPIDHQIIIPKSQEVGKIKQDEANKQVANQQQGTEVNQKNVDAKMKRINKKDEARQEGVKKKMKDEDGKEEKKKKNKKDQKDEDEKGSCVDIKI